MNTIKISKKELAIIVHSLGLVRSKKPSRNYYCAPTDDAELGEMVEKNLMRRGRIINDGRDTYYIVTAEGADFVGATLPCKS